MESSLLPSVLGGLFLLCAIAIAIGFALLLKRLRAENRPAEGPSEEDPAAGAPKKGLKQAWPMIGGVIAVALVTCGLLLAVDSLTPSGQPVVVKVTAHQFGWQFDYYQAGSGDSFLETVNDPRRGAAKTLPIRSLGVSSKDTLTLPKDADVLFLVTSIDVVHRFWAPEFSVRRDVVPGVVTNVWVHPRRVGRFIVRSDDVCGADDRLMVAALDIVDEDGFHAWLTSKASPENLAPRF